MGYVLSLIFPVLFARLFLGTKFDMLQKCGVCFLVLTLISPSFSRVHLLYNMLQKGEVFVLFFPGYLTISYSGVRCFFFGTEKKGEKEKE